MTPVKLYEKPGCRTCRAVRALLDDSGVAWESVDVTAASLSEAIVRELLDRVGITVTEALREPERAEGSTDGEVLSLLATRPELMVRPIVDTGQRAILARPPARAGEVVTLPGRTELARLLLAIGDASCASPR